MKKKIHIMYGVFCRVPVPGYLVGTIIPWYQIGGTHVVDDRPVL